MKKVSRPSDEALIRHGIAEDVTRVLNGLWEYGQRLPVQEVRQAIEQGEMTDERIDEIYETVNQLLEMKTAADATVESAAGRVRTTILHALGRPGDEADPAA